MTEAVPPTRVPLWVGDPSPKSKTTVPVGVPAPGATGATTAVMVTGWPTTDGSGDDDTTVVVAAWFTVCVSEPLEPA
ncbi:hypothetical protein [Streptomyces anandii]|uniref:hypothetical protein n=1 Tax=Streptomyces anandii TaxID=285454 RepID=UPI003796CA95